MAASFEKLRSLAYGSITNSGYTAIGTPLTNPSAAFRIVNNTDGDILISIDGVNDYFFLPAGTFVLYDVQSNRNYNKSFLFPQATQFYAKYSSSPSKNSVYVESMYSTIPGY